MAVRKQRFPLPAELTVPEPRVNYLNVSVLGDHDDEGIVILVH